MKISEATILVVDDEPELCEIFAAWLSRAGCKVLTAANGALALETIQTTKIDAMLSDIRMPVMDGIALVRRLHELGIRLPSIIFVSGFGDIDAREMHAIGVEMMIAKPIAREQLLAALGNCLALRSELWLAPMPTKPEVSLEIDLPPVPEATAQRAFRLGRGGFCVACPRVLAECSVDFRIRFADDGPQLKGQGRVRWAAANEGRLGIEIHYIHPDSREWILAALSEEASPSYIPRC